MGDQIGHIEQMTFDMSEGRDQYVQIRFHAIWGAYEIPPHQLQSVKDLHDQLKSDDLGSWNQKWNTFLADMTEWRNQYPQEITVK